MITVNSLRFDGTIRKSWQCELLEQRGSLLVAVGEFDSDIQHSDLGHIKRGTVSHEFYWLDRWYNIFRFHEPTGEFRNFYCNVSAPAKFENGVLDYVDLDIDLMIDANSRLTVLDREDYERNIAAFGYPTEVQANVERSLSELLEVFEKKEMPGLPELFATTGIAARELG